MNRKIFVQIASYRDPQLVPTVLDCVAKAKWPENLVFCICWQHDDKENIDAIRHLPNIRIIDVLYQESQGACWARNQIQQYWNGESYTLQIDSHHRFAENWDELVLDMFHQLLALGHKKPLLTCYPPSFDPDNDPAGRSNVPWQVNFNTFNDDGVLGMIPSELENWKTLTSPVPTRFYSAGFCFTWGQFSREVPHDPWYYFLGEEINITVRAWTHGYDLFHPHRIIVWHFYTRKGATRHWDDHKEEKRDQLAEKRAWSERSKLAVYRNKCFFQQDNHAYGQIEWGPYGMGRERSIRSYELFAGIHFPSRRVQQQTLDKISPPNAYWRFKNDPEWYASLLKQSSHSISVDAAHFKHDDYSFMCVAFERKDNTLINRTDMPGAELLNLIAKAKASDGRVVINSKFYSKDHPHHCVIWPYSKKKQWVERLSALVPRTDVTQTIASPSAAVAVSVAPEVQPPPFEQDQVQKPDDLQVP